MFGYACDETDDLMPLPIWLAHRLAHRLSEVRKAGILPYLRPDGKTQVTFDYEDGRPVTLKTVLISTQHAPNLDPETLIKPDLKEHVIHPLLPPQFADDGFDVLVNPTGTFELGGPHADTGLTGRKIIVDTYGGMARHGGGAFSGKDPSKVDRSAAYAARWVAKHVVAAGAAKRCEIQVAYAIGVARPVSIMVETFGTEQVDPAQHQRPRSTRSSTCVPRRSSATSTCVARSTDARPRTATSVGPRRSSPGSTRPGWTTCAARLACSARARRGLIVRVLPDGPIDKAFDYLVPERLRALAVVGAQVRVPVARSPGERLDRRGRRRAAARASTLAEVIAVRGIGSACRTSSRSRRGPRIDGPVAWRRCSPRRRLPSLVSRLPPALMGTVPVGGGVADLPPEALERAGCGRAPATADRPPSARARRSPSRSRPRRHSVRRDGPRPRRPGPAGGRRRRR